jgi:PIN domain nuclease of toxin-antitoxin system
VFLLDTHALLWLDSGARRAEPLLDSGGRLFISPVSLLEIRILEESGKYRLARGRRILDFAKSERWELDDPSAMALVGTALDLPWTRDPFDRLLFAHALARNWRLATADQHILEHADPKRIFEL